MIHILTFLTATATISSIPNNLTTKEILNKILASETNNSIVISDDNLTNAQLTKIVLCTSPAITLLQNQKALKLDNCDGRQHIIRTSRAQYALEATRPIETGEQITTHNTKKSIISKTDDALESIDANTTALKRINVGELITKTNSEKNPDVRAGQQIKAMVKIGGIVLSRLVTAKTDGYVNQQIEVEETTTKFFVNVENGSVVLKTK